MALLNKAASWPAHSLDRAYVECEKANIAKPEVEKLEKVAKAKEQAIQLATMSAEQAQSKKAA